MAWGMGNDGTRRSGHLRFKSTLGTTESPRANHPPPSLAASPVHPPLPLPSHLHYHTHLHSTLVSISLSSNDGLLCPSAHVAAHSAPLPSPCPAPLPPSDSLHLRPLVICAPSLFSGSPSLSVASSICPLPLVRPHPPHLPARVLPHLRSHSPSEGRSADRRRQRCPCSGSASVRLVQ